MTGEMIMWIALALIGLCGSFCCSGVELGSYTLSRLRLDVRAERSPPDVRARTLRQELERPGRFLSTLLVSNSVFNAVLSRAGSEIFGEGKGGGEGVVLSTLLVAPLLIVIGELLPKELFRIHADTWTYAFARPVRVVRTLLTWTGVMALTDLVSRSASRVLRIESGAPAIVDARRHMADLVKEGGSSTELSESQSSLIDRALALKQTPVDVTMTEWIDVRRMDETWDREQAIAFAANQTSARLPVVDRRGRVVGALRVTDLYVTPNASIKELMSEPARLDPRTPVLEALRRVQACTSRLGIVERDGKPLGVVTARDLLESLTGELPDL